MTKVILAALALAACSPSKADKSCAALRDRFRVCTDNKWPAQTVSDLHLRCLVAMRYQPEPNDSPQNLAALDKAMFEDCAAKTTCGDLTACFAVHGCSFLFTSPTDTNPQLYCTFPRK